MRSESLTAGYWPQDIYYLDGRWPKYDEECKTDEPTED